MNGNTGKIEINRDHYEYCARYRDLLMEGMEPLSNNLGEQILKDYYEANALIEAGKAVLV